MTPSTPSDSSYQRVSRLTLALLADTGWFSVDWTSAPSLNWGRNAGCDMAKLTSDAFRAVSPCECFATQKNNIWAGLNSIKDQPRLLIQTTRRGIFKFNAAYLRFITFCFVSHFLTILSTAQPYFCSVPLSSSQDTICTFNGLSKVAK